MGRGAGGQGAGSHQPDLVKVSSPRAPPHAEISRLENVVDQQNRLVQDIRIDAMHNAKGFDAMTTLVGYLANDALSVPQLRATISQFQQELREAKAESGNLRELYKTHNETLQKKTKEREEERRKLEAQQEEKLNELLKKHSEELEHERRIAANKGDEIVEKHESLLSQLTERHEKEVSTFKSEHKEVVAALETRLARQEVELAEAWRDERNKLEQRIGELEVETKGFRDNMLKDSDIRLQIAHTKMCNLQQEIESLKTVVDMRTAEVHELRAERTRLEEKLELFDKTQQNLKKLQAQVEDLREQISAKSDLERKLSEEKRILHKSLEKESCEKKRLSMENEQLFWKIRQSSETQLQDLPPIEGSNSMEGPLSFSYCEGTFNSLPLSVPTRSFTRGGRPLSAPPGKQLTLGLSPRSLLDEDVNSLPPDSPRVLEIVEKNESVSWKLEYEMSPGDQRVSPSPNTKRKLSPTSPIVLRKFRGREGPMSRSLDRSPLSRSLDRSSSFTPGMTENAAMLARQNLLLQRSNSVRKKIIPSFEPLSESTESESDESRKTSPVNENNDLKNIDEIKASSEPVPVPEQPAPVNIAGSHSDDDMCDISSSSEIEIGEERIEISEERFFPVNQEETDQDCLLFPEREVSESDSDLPSPETEVTLRSELSSSTALSVGGGSRMSSSLPSYDLAMLFHYKESAGESLIEETMESLPTLDSLPESSESEISVEKRVDLVKNVMNDSVSTASWSEDIDDQLADDEEVE